MGHPPPTKEQRRTMAVRFLSGMTLLFLAEGTIALCLTEPARAGNDTRAEASILLQRCLAMQSLTDHVSMRVANLRDIPDSVDGWPRDQRAETLLRRDGDRLDVSLCYRFPETDPDFKHRSHRSRGVITRDLCVWSSCPISKPDPPRSGIVSSHWPQWCTSMGLNQVTGATLDGYFPTTGTHRAAELMQEAGDLRIRGVEVIGGTPCKMVAATTRHGTYTMWLAEEKGCLPLRVTYEIGPDDLRHYTDDRPFSALSIPTPDGQKHLGSKGTGVVEDVVVACIGTAYVPVAGKFTDTQ